MHWWHGFMHTFFFMVVTWVFEINMELNISGLQVRACKTFVLLGGGQHINAAIHTLSREHAHTHTQISNTTS